jgi:hypothetical protein
MAETLREFLVSFGFAAQDSTRAEADAAAAQKRVTDSDAKALTQREKNAADALGRMAAAYDAARTDHEKKDKDADKRSSDRRAAALRQTQDYAVRMAATATKIVASVTGAATAVFVATERAARSMERLNYMSQRTGASPGGVSAFAYAASQTGGSVEGANESLEKFGDNLRRFPQAYEGALKNLGVQTRDVKGNLRETSALATDLVEKLSKLPRAQRSVQGGFFGINEETLQAGSRPEFRQRYNEREEINRRVGFDPDKAAAGGTAFEQSMRRLDAVLGAIKDKVTTGLFDKLQPDVDKLATWATENGPHVAEIFGRIADDLLKLANVVLDKIVSIDWDGIITKVENFGKEFDRLARQYFGADGITLVFDAFGAMLAVSVLARLVGIINAMRTLASLTPAPWLLRLIGAPAAAGAAVVGSLLASGDPAKAALSGGTPDVKAQDNDLGLPGTDAGTGDRTRSTVKSSGVWGWLQSKLGFGGDDQRVKDAIIQTAESTKKLVENAAAGTGSGGFAGATASSGGVGGSGAHFSGSSSPGASIGDRAHGSRGGGGAADPNLPVGNVPGATGYGATNAYWKGPLDKRGEGNHTGPKEMYDYLKSQGATDNEALLLTGSAASESSFNPNAVHDGGTGHGLFGHKDTRLDMRGKTWQQQSVLALGELRRTLGRQVANARTPEELTDVEMHNERPRGYKPNNPRAGDNYMGRLNSIRRFSVLTGKPTAQAPVPAGTSAAAVSDAEVFAARQRLAAGGTSAADRALVGRYKEQQAQPSTLGAARDKLKAAMDAGAGGGSVPTIAITEDSIRKLGNHIREKTNAQPLSDSKHQSMNTSSRVLHLTNAPTFNLKGGHHDTMLASAHRSSSRGQQDLLRNVQSAEV